MNRLVFYMALMVGLSILSSCNCKSETVPEKVGNLIAEEVIQNAEWALAQSPVTLIDFVCERSAGSPNEFYSEGDYWWPDPENPEGPYIRRDGETNPDNFVAHRHAMIRLSQIVGYLTSAYVLTGDDKYARQAMTHLHAWFVDPATRMQPHLLYAQAIKGRVAGRGIGIIDTIHLIEVAQALNHLMASEVVNKNHLSSVIKWFDAYKDWLTTHPYGIDEREAKNNHGTCWVMQVAAFAHLTNDEALQDYCRDRYKTVLLPTQMAQDGSFPLETVRTKPYGYSLFNLDAMATICQILSTKEDNLWTYTTESGLGIALGIEFLVPYVADKGQWPYEKDVMYWSEWPVAHPFLIFSAVEFEDMDRFNLWKTLERNSEVDEVIRNWPIRNPLLWL